MMNIHQYPHNHVFRNKAVRLTSRKDLNKLHRAPSHLSHQIIFAVKQLRMDELTEELYAVSDPSSPKYGQHWTKAQVAEFTKNEEGYNRIKEYLDRFGIKVVSETLHGEYITAEATVGEWESFFKTEFFIYKFVLNDSRNWHSPHFIRCEEYFLPLEIEPAVHAAFNTIHFLPPQRHRRRLHKMNDDFTLRAHEKPVHDMNDIQWNSPGLVFGYVTPELLNQYYGITNNTGGPLVTQAVYEAINDAMSPNDLTYFQEYFNLSIQSISDVVGGHVDNKACDINYYDDCGESNLDVQYMMGIAQNIPTTYWYDPDDYSPWITWLISVNSVANPPDIFSISYGMDEIFVGNEYAVAFNTEAIKLGVMGTTIFVASGDDGALSWMVRNSTAYCFYAADFPATSPYVTAVGATQGPESGTKEVSCTSLGGGIITSGGGFSDLYRTPSFQVEVVKEYFKQVDGTEKEPYYSREYDDFLGLEPGKYSRNGRGYPDISLVGYAYLVAINGSLVRLSGTSATSPVMAAMTSLVNYQRKLHNYPTMGWLNPFLYRYSSYFAKDITEGFNNCSAGHLNVPGEVHSCREGFYAAKGWDPVTGLGSVNYTGYLTAAMIAATKTSSSSSGSSNEYSAGFIAGMIVLAVVVGLGVIIGLGFFLSKFLKPQPHQYTQPTMQKQQNEVDTVAVVEPHANL